MLKRLVNNKILLAIIVLIALLSSLYIPLLSFIGNYLIIDDSIRIETERDIDAIIVLAGDPDGSRVKEAVKLYKSGIGRYLIMSGNNIAWNTNLAEIMKREAIDMGIEPSSIIELRHNGYSTIEEIKIIKDFLKDKPYRKILFITSNFHTRRSKWVINKVFKDSAIKSLIHPSIDINFDPASWWKNRQSAKTIFFEYTKFFWYIFIERFRL